MARSDANLRVLITAKNQAAGVLRGFNRDVNKSTAALKLLGVATVAAFGAVAVKSVSAAISFESAFADVRKTVDGTTEQLADLRQGIRDMSKELPASASRISEVAAAAGQLGIETDNVLAFSRVMVDLGETTNLSATDAATALARLANITQLPQDEFDRLGSTVVALGNNLATTEAEIVQMGLGLAGTGKLVGLSEAQILGLAGALSSVGIEAQRGGTAFSTALALMESAALSGGEELENFAAVAGLSAEEFRSAWQDDAGAAVTTFIEGLGRVADSGENVFAILEELGLGEKRVRDTFLRIAGAGDLVRTSLELGNVAWEENIALSDEAAKRYETTGAKLSILKNNLNDVAITLGDLVLPALNRFVSRLNDELLPAVQEFAQTHGPAMLQALKDWQPVLEQAAEDIRTVAEGVKRLGDYLLGNQAAIVAAIIAIGAAFAWALPGPTGLVFAIGAIGAAIVLMRSDLDEMSISALEARLSLEKLTLASIRGTNAFLDKFPIVGELRNAYELLRGEGDKLRQTEDAVRDRVAAATAELVDQKIALNESNAGFNETQKAILAVAQAQADLTGWTRDLIRETNAAVNAAATQVSGLQVLADAYDATKGSIQEYAQALMLPGLIEEGLTPDMILRRLESVKAAIGQATKPPDDFQNDWVSSATATGAAAGKALAEELRRSVLDMPAVSPEELTRILRFLEAADFTTVGDQLAFVEAMTRNAEQALIDMARAAEEKAAAAFSLLASAAGISGRQLEVRFGMRDELQELNAAVRLWADALGITEAAVLSLLGPGMKLAEVVDEQTEAMTRARFALQDHVGVYELMSQAFEEHRQNLADLIPTIDDVTGAFSSFFSLTADQTEKLLRTVPELGAALDWAFKVGEDSLRAMLKELGVAKTVIDDVIDGFFDMAEAGRAIGDIARDFGSFLGASQAQIDEVLQGFPAIAAAIEAATQKELRAFVAELFAAGVPLFEILDYMDQITAAVAATNDELRDMQGILGGIGRFSAGAARAILEQIGFTPNPNPIVGYPEPPALPPGPSAVQPAAPAALEAGTPAQTIVNVYPDQIIIQGDPTEGLAALGVSVS